MRSQWTYRYLGTIAVLIVMTILFKVFSPQIDLTSDKRYTLSALSQDIVADIDQPLEIIILLDGEIPLSFQGYRNYLDQYLGTLRRKYNNVTITYKDPNEGAPQDVNQFKSYLRAQGVNGLSRRVADASEVRQSELFPFVAIQYANRTSFVDLLENKGPNETEQEAIMRSQLSFEAKLLKSIRNISATHLPNVRILGGKNQLLAEGLQRDPRAKGYRYIAEDAEGLLSNIDSTDLLIVIGNQNFGPRTLLSIDQIALREIPVIWFVDKYDVTVDSLATAERYLAYNQDYNWEDYWFKLGVKLAPELVYDIQCTSIPQVTGTQGGQSRTELFPFQLHPLLIPQELNNGMRLGSEPIATRFISTLDTIRSSFDLEKEILLTTSPYTRTKKSPVALGFDMLRVEPQPTDYSSGLLPVALQVRGTAQTQYLNRTSTTDKEWLAEYLEGGTKREGKIRQTLIADVDLIMPPQGRDGKFSAIGYDFWERKMYDGNIEFVMNLLETSIHGDDFLYLAQRELSNPILDTEAFHNSKSRFILILLVLPIIILLFSYFLYQYLRKRKYSAL